MPTRELVHELRGQGTRRRAPQLCREIGQEHLRLRRLVPWSRQRIAIQSLQDLLLGRIVPGPRGSRLPVSRSAHRRPCTPRSPIGPRQLAQSHPSRRLLHPAPVQGTAWANPAGGSCLERRHTRRTEAYGAPAPAMGNCSSDAAGMGGRPALSSVASTTAAISSADCDSHPPQRLETRNTAPLPPKYSFQSRIHCAATSMRPE